MAGSTCFVVMGFGVKTDFLTGRSLDLDKSYRTIIKPAAEDAGLVCVRADEIIHSGSIDVAMYHQLLEADVVVADISTCNPNALYELGVRHALRPFTTITIAEDQITYPFDVNHIVIRRYQHLGKGIDYEEATRFRKELADAIRALVGRPEPDSPVYTILARLRPPILEMAEAMAEAFGSDGTGPPATDETLSDLCCRADEAIKSDRFEVAKALYEAAGQLRANDPFLVQRLALATYKSGIPTPLEALEEARVILLGLFPEVSNDPETLGLWGAVHKRLWRETGERAHLDTAVLAYERGFDIRNDYYNGINLAYLFNVRAKISPPADQIADFVNAERVRRRVIPICEEALESGPRNPADRYWLKATLAESCLGIGAAAAAEDWERQANDENVGGWMRQTTHEQLAALRDLLHPSPLAGIRAPHPAP